MQMLCYDLATFSWTDLQFFAVIERHHLVGIYGLTSLNSHPSVPTMISAGGSDQLSWRTTSLANSAGFMPLPLSVLTMMSVAAKGREGKNVEVSKNDNSRNNRGWHPTFI